MNERKTVKVSDLSVNDRILVGMFAMPATVTRNTRRNGANYLTYRMENGDTVRVFIRSDAPIECDTSHTARA